MAQVLGYYTSSISGGQGYIYSAPDYSAEHWAAASGTALTIAANESGDGPESYDNGFYGLTNGTYVRHQDCGMLTAVYVTTADACSPPTSVTLDTAAKTLTISGGAGGDLNAFAGYCVRCRDQLIGSDAWGEWTYLATLAGEPATLTVDAPAGYARQFDAFTVGAAGDGYYSAPVACATLLYGNAAPGTPAISIPAANAIAATVTPTIVVSCPAEPDGGAQTLRRQINGGEWTDIASVPPEGGTVYDTLPTLPIAIVTFCSVTYQLTDAHGLRGLGYMKLFKVAPPTWARTIAPGAVISNATVSHQADITELRNAVNKSRAWYGLAAISLPGTLGALSDWKAQMDALQAGLTAAHLAAGKAAPAWPAVPGYPTAAIVNGLRAGLI